MVLALAALWFGLLKPSVRAAAREAVAEDATVQDARSEAAAARKQAGAANGKAAAALGASKPGGKKGGQAAAPDTEGEPFSRRLSVTASAPDGQDGDSYTVPDDKTLHLTDMVLENPQGDAGTVVVKSGDRPLLALALENFRDQDYHWLTPIDVPGKGSISVSISCRQVGKPVNQTPQACHEAMYLGGVLDSSQPQP